MAWNGSGGVRRMRGNYRGPRTQQHQYTKVEVLSVTPIGMHIKALNDDHAWIRWSKFYAPPKRIEVGDKFIAVGVTESDSVLYLDWVQEEAKASS